MSPETRSRRDTTLLLAISAAVIVNSHLERFYPAGYAFLAADGLLGNSMFYLLSGYAIEASLSARRQGFWGFIGRRILRIYPAVILVGAAALGVELLRGASPAFETLLARFVWPTPHTYVQLIILFYAMGFVLRLGGVRTLVVAIGGLVGLYAAAVWHEAPSLAPGTHLSLGHASKTAAITDYAMVFLLGMLLHKINLSSGRVSFWPVLALLTAVPAYFALKFLMVVRGEFSSFYWTLHGLVAVICWAGFLVGTRKKVSTVFKTSPLWPAIAFVGGLSLEIYIVHETLLTHTDIARIIFPLNILILVAATLVLAPMVQFAGRLVQTRLASSNA